ncbi:MAG: glycosyltransferase family 9 protein, partial [Ignavibacteriales bacterium]|nr:glycosyltransferase family 9 protein [Ignavibacteriales bacterium]
MSFVQKIISSRKEKEARFYEFIQTKKNVRKILVLRNGLLGDIVFITPVLERLHKTFPSSIIDVVVSEQAKELLHHNPAIRTIRYLHSDPSLTEQTKLYSTLRHEQYDIALILESNTHYSIMSPFIGAKYVVTFQNSWDFLADISVAWKDGVHHVASELETVKSWTDNPSEHTLRLYVSENEITNAKELLMREGITDVTRIFCFHPGCNEPNSVRQWIVERYAQLADSLSELYNIQIIFTGVKRDRQEIELIQQKMKCTSVNLAGNTS